MSVEEQIGILIKLQEIDSQIFKLKKELETQPVIIRGLEESFRVREAVLKQAEEEAKMYAVNRKEKELALQTKEEEIKKLQSQLYQLKTNKEYQAMEKEIAGKKADVSVIEEEIIKALDRIDESVKKTAAAKEVLNQERKALDAQKAKVEVRAKELEASLQTLRAGRQELTAKAEKEFLKKYERILNSKNGLAMVPVAGDSCGGCNINLPPQVINEIRMKQELIFCGSCARILYIEKDEDQKS